MQLSSMAELPNFEVWPRREGIDSMHILCKLLGFRKVLGRSQAFLTGPQTPLKTLEWSKEDLNGAFGHRLSLTGGYHQIHRFPPSQTDTGLFVTIWRSPLAEGAETSRMDHDPLFCRWADVEVASLQTTKCVELRYQRVLLHTSQKGFCLVTRPRHTSLRALKLMHFIPIH